LRSVAAHSRGYSGGKSVIVWLDTKGRRAGTGDGSVFGDPLTAQVIMRVTKKLVVVSLFSVVASKRKGRKEKVMMVKT